jgi:hypothetical protein
MSTDSFVDIPSGSFQSPIELSPLDQLAASLIVRILWRFETPSFNQKSLASNLQRGLRRCLQDLPFHAARIVRDEQNGGKTFAATEPGIQLHFRDFSSPGLSKLWTAGSYHGLKEARFPLSRLRLVYHVLTNKTMMARGSDSVLDIQVSFVGGGAFILIAYHHGYMGGLGLNIFLERWAWYTAAISRTVEPRPLPELSPGANDRPLLP